MSFGSLIVLKKNGSEGSKYPLFGGQKCKIGSSDDCQVRFGTDECIYCAISLENNGTIKLQKMSKYPVLVNDSEIRSPKVITSGDCISVGTKIFRFDICKKENADNTVIGISNKTKPKSTINPRRLSAAPKLPSTRSGALLKSAEKIPKKKYKYFDEFTTHKSTDTPKKYFTSLENTPENSLKAASPTKTKSQSKPDTPATSKKLTTSVFKTPNTDSSKFTTSLRKSVRKLTPRTKIPGYSFKSETKVLPIPVGKYKELLSAEQIPKMSKPTRIKVISPKQLKLGVKLQEKMSKLPIKTSTQLKIKNSELEVAKLKTIPQSHSKVLGSKIRKTPTSNKKSPCSTKKTDFSTKKSPCSTKKAVLSSKKSPCSTKKTPVSTKKTSSSRNITLLNKKTAVLSSAVRFSKRSPSSKKSSCKKTPILQNIKSTNHTSSVPKDQMIKNTNSLSIDKIKTPSSPENVAVTPPRKLLTPAHFKMLFNRTSNSDNKVKKRITKAKNKMTPLTVPAKSKQRSSLQNKSPLLIETTVMTRSRKTPKSAKIAPLSFKELLPLNNTSKIEEDVSSSESSAKTPEISFNKPPITPNIKAIKSAKKKHDRVTKSALKRSTVKKRKLSDITDRIAKKFQTEFLDEIENERPLLVNSFKEVTLNSTNSFDSSNLHSNFDSVSSNSVLSPYVHVDRTQSMLKSLTDKCLTSSLIDDHSNLSTASSKTSTPKKLSLHKTRLLSSSNCTNSSMDLFNVSDVSVVPNDSIIAVANTTGLSGIQSLPNTSCESNLNDLSSPKPSPKARRIEKLVTPVKIIASISNSPLRRSKHKYSLSNLVTTSKKNTPKSLNNSKSKTSAIKITAAISNSPLVRGKQKLQLDVSNIENVNLFDNISLNNSAITRNTCKHDLKNEESDTFHETTKTNKYIKFLSNDISVLNLSDENNFKNELTAVEGLDKLFRAQKSPMKDITDPTDVIGATKIPNRDKNSLKNDLSNLIGLNQLFSSPVVQNVSELKGIRSLSNTPEKSKTQKYNSSDDLGDLQGVNRLLGTPKDSMVSPKNYLSDVRGVKNLMKIPDHSQKSPRNDLSDVRGVKMLFGTPKDIVSPKNDLTYVRGVKNLMKTPNNSQKSPRNDLSDLCGVQKLLSTPKDTSPKNDLTDVEGISNLYKEQMILPATNLEIAENTSPKDHKNLSASAIYDKMFDELQNEGRACEDKKLLVNPVLKTYERKTKSLTLQKIEINNEIQNVRKSFPCTKKSIVIEKWIEEQNLYTNKATESIEFCQKNNENVKRPLQNRFQKLSRPVNIDGPIMQETVNTPEFKRKSTQRRDRLNLENKNRKEGSVESLNIVNVITTNAVIEHEDTPRTQNRNKNMETVIVQDKPIIEARKGKATYKIDVVAVEEIEIQKVTTRSARKREIIIKTVDRDTSSQILDFFNLNDNPDNNLKRSVVSHKKKGEFATTEIAKKKAKFDIAKGATETCTKNTRQTRSATKQNANKMNKEVRESVATSRKKNGQKIESIKLPAKSRKKVIKEELSQTHEENIQKPIITRSRNKKKQEEKTQSHESEQKSRSRSTRKKNVPVEEPTRVTRARSVKT